MDDRDEADALARGWDGRLSDDESDGAGPDGAFDDDEDEDEDEEATPARSTTSGCRCRSSPRTSRSTC